MKRVLIADDEYAIIELYKIYVEGKGGNVIAVAHTYAETITQACDLIPDIAFIDINMDYKVAGIDACRFIKEKHPEIKVYLVTAYAKEVFEEELKNLCFDGYIDKADFEGMLPELLK